LGDFKRTAKGFSKFRLVYEAWEQGKSQKKKGGGLSL